jgi:SSS family solute:Na+ symporter
MLTTSLSQDLYKRFIRPDASDDRVLTVARWATLVSGLFGVALAWTTEDVIDTLTIFYALVSVGLFVPIVGGLYVPRTTTSGAFASISVGLALTIVVHIATGGTGWRGFSAPFLGIVSTVVVWAVSLLARPPTPAGEGGSADEKRSNRVV